MNNLIACHLMCYRPYLGRRDEIYSHILEQGIRHLETYVPGEGGQPSKILPELDRYGLILESVRTAYNLASETGLDKAVDHIRQIAGETSCRRIVPSLQEDGIGPTTAYSRLRRLGDAAAAHGMVICPETHPALFMNGDSILATLREVDHPHIRCNFDTANIYYYNRNLDTVDELGKIKDHVGSVHLKDTLGGFHVYSFPALGEGIVDFKRIINLLNAAGFTGPFSMELEGTRGRRDSFEEKKRIVERSVAHLRSLEVWD